MFYAVLFFMGETSTSNFMFTAITYINVVIWGLCRQSGRKFVRHNLPKLNTLTYWLALVMINLMYRGYFNLGGISVATGTTQILYLIFFSCFNYNSIRWIVFVENPVTLALQYFIWKVEQEFLTQNCFPETTEQSTCYFFTAAG